MGMFNNRKNIELKSDKFTTQEWIFLLFFLCILLVAVWKVPDHLQLIILAVTAYFLLKSFRETQRGAKATTEIMKCTTIAERPYVTLVFSPVSDEEQITANCRIKNYGRTVALDVRYELVACDGDYMSDIKEEVGKNDYRRIDERILEDFKKLDFSDSAVEDKKTYSHFHLQQDMEHNMKEGVDIGEFLTLGKDEYREIRGLSAFGANDVLHMNTGSILCVLSYNDLFGRSYQVKTLHHISHTYEYTTSEMLRAEIRFQGEKDGKSEKEIKAAIDEVPIIHAIWNDARVDTLSVYSWDFYKDEWIEGRQPQRMSAE